MDYESHAIDKALSQQYSIITYIYMCVGGFGKKFQKMSKNVKKRQKISKNVKKCQKMSNDIF